MAQSNIVICANCGQAKNQYEHDEYQPRTEHDEASHDWSEDDPLARLEARVLASDEMMRIDSEDNDNWQWIAVGLNDGTGFDPVGSSEGLANWVAEEGFAFNGVGEGDNVVRFNRKK